MRVVLCPEQMDVFPAIAALIELFTVTFTLSLVVPQELVTEKVYVPVDEGEMEIEVVVCPPGFQVYEVPVPVPARVMVAPEQMVTSGPALATALAVARVSANIMIPGCVFVLSVANLLG